MSTTDLSFSNEISANLPTAYPIPTHRGEKMRVDFYLLEKQAAEAIYPFACRLLEKIYKQGEKVFVVMNNKEECETLNRLVWNYQDTSFIPHCLATDAVAKETPIQLGLISQLINHKIVLNLSNESLSALTSLDRIIEIVPDEPVWRQASRQKFLNYKNQQCELHTHKIEIP